MSNMEKTSFKSLHKNRILFIEKNKNKDHAIISGINNFLISAPHGVSQVRLGKLKHSEIGSLTTALQLQKDNDCYLIAKTKNNYDDANFDEVSKYKNSIKNLIKNKDIKYLIDIHGLASSRECDINLGTHLGKNIKSNIDVFNNLQQSLQNAGFKVAIDQPFMAGSRTISGSINNEFNIWTIQIEINSSITNKKENFNRFKILLQTLNNWLQNIKKL